MGKFGSILAYKYRDGSLRESNSFKHTWHSVQQSLFLQAAAK